MAEIKHEWTVGGRSVFCAGDPTSECMFLQPVDEHDTERLQDEMAALKKLSGTSDWALVTVPVESWGNDLTPWAAPAVFGNEGFGCGAPETLAFILNDLLPYVEKEYPQENRRIFLCGYSLAGFFSLWAAYQSDVFSGAAAVSPSVWYPGWLDYARTHSVKVPRVYLSLGLKEEKARNRVMATVGDAIREEYRLLSDAGVSCTLEWNPGNHFIESDLRMAKGMAWLLG
ncbi:MAG: esterase [Lachnospiraceae bacterium]|nr:esterase [Lachnospiraceae bacterium]